MEGVPQWHAQLRPTRIAVHIIAVVIGGLALCSGYFAWWGWNTFTPLTQVAFAALPLVFASACALVVAHIKHNDFLQRCGLFVLYPSITTFFVAYGIEQFLL